mmetsp:Transcript_13320/g.45189  ORF Transcript_13320/g.45189 Transcript_13320/m.45189 type:complete len:230 (-) Transcript_13320:759-1448(-)
MGGLPAASRPADACPGAPDPPAPMLAVASTSRRATRIAMDRRPSTRAPTACLSKSRAASISGQPNTTLRILTPRDSSRFLLHQHTLRLDAATPLGSRAAAMSCSVLTELMVIPKPRVPSMQQKRGSHAGIAVQRGSRLLTPSLRSPDREQVTSRRRARTLPCSSMPIAPSAQSWRRASSKPPSAGVFWLLGRPSLSRSEAAPRLPRLRLESTRMPSEIHVSRTPPSVDL